MHAMPGETPETARSSDVVAVERCLFEVRQGRPVCLIDGEHWLVIAGLEGAQTGHFSLLRAFADGPIELLISAGRAAALGLGAWPVCLPCRSEDETRRLIALAVDHPVALDRAALAQDARPVERRSMADAALGLARAAEALPALLIARPNGSERLRRQVAEGVILTATVAAVDAFRAHRLSRVTRMSEADVPLHDGQTGRFVAYRAPGASTDHVAILVGRPETADAPLVRLHSACFTGDIFHSLRCDCREQLMGSLTRMAGEGAGIICYLAQEGRGIGIANKLRAYMLQDHGFDTLEANEALGFDADERDFSVAAAMLRDLGATRVRILTNNPDKIAALREGGIAIAERVASTATLNRHNERYFRARIEKSGYLFAPR